MPIVIKAKNKDKELELIEKILKNFKDEIESVYGPVVYAPPIPLPTEIPINLLNLPDHLKKSAIKAYELRNATAYQVSLATGRKRAVESAYLNQLVTMGYLKKERKGREVYFYVEPKR